MSSIKRSKKNSFNFQEYRYTSEIHILSYVYIYIYMYVVGPPETNLFPDVWVHVVCCVFVCVCVVCAGKRVCVCVRAHARAHVCGWVLCG